MDKIYNYLNEKKVAIVSSVQYIERIDGFFENKALINNSNPDCVISIEEAKSVKIKRDERYPYASTRISIEDGNKRIDFLRYNTLVYTIYELFENKFFIKSAIPLSEEGALRCFRKFYYGQESSKSKVLVHATCVKVGQSGVLIPGDSRSGKTTLAVGMLEELGAEFISDENTLLSFEGDSIIAHYVPRPIQLRFHTIVSSKKLCQILDNLELCEATQNIDEDAITRIIEARAFYVNAGLNISRRNFSNILQCKTGEQVKLDTVIFPFYTDEANLTVEDVDCNKGFALLEEKELKKEVKLEELKKAADYSTIDSFFPQELCSKFALNFKKIFFKNVQQLSRTKLEDIL